MKKFKELSSILMLVLLITAGVLGGCGDGEDEASVSTPAPDTAAVSEAENNEIVESAVSFSHTLDDYQPRKKKYNFYFTYKLVHSWWDAVAMGLEDAMDQYAERGITINYEYLAPSAVSAEDQKKRILEAAERGFDVIGVDVAESSRIAPVINQVMRKGQKVITFSSSDTEPKHNCDRIAFIGNTHNKQDGADLAEALCKKIGYKGKVGIIVGDPGAPCHEERLAGAKSVLEKYPEIQIIGVDYDRESSDRAEKITERFLESDPDLAGMICCNMVNPVGAARAIKAHGLEGQVTIVGMDHDERALRMMKEGVIYCLGVQDCYSMGFDTMRIAVMVADGVEPGDGYEQLTDEKTTLIYQKDAVAMLYKLYGRV